MAEVQAIMMTRSAFIFKGQKIAVEAHIEDNWGGATIPKPTRYVREVPVNRLCPLLPDFIRPAFLRSSGVMTILNSTFALKVRNQGSAKAGIFDGSEISTIMTTLR